MASDSLSEISDKFVYYLSRWLREVEHPYEAGTSFSLLSMEDRLPRLLVQFLLLPVSEARLGAVGASLLTAFARYESTSRIEPAPLFSAMREIASCFEPFLKKLAYRRFPTDETWHQAIPEILYRLYPVSQEFRGNCNKPDAAFWLSRPAEEAVLRVAVKERHKASHEAWAMPLPELERVVQCVLAAMLLVCRLPENRRVLEKVVQSSRLARLEELTTGDIFEIGESTAKRFDEYAGLGLALDSLTESDLFWGPIAKPVFSQTVSTAKEDRRRIHSLSIGELQCPGYKQDVIEALGRLTDVADEWEAYFNPRIARQAKVDLNGDGKPEFVAVLSYPRGVSYSPLSSNNILCVCEEGTDHYLPVLVRALDEFFDDVKIEDINGDGTPELVTTCFAGAHSMWVHIFQWDGNAYRELLPHDREGVSEGTGFFSSAPGIQVRDGEVVVWHRDYGSGKPWEYSFKDTYHWDGARYLHVGREYFGP